MITIVVALFQQFWKNRRDHFNARVDDFCKIVFEAANMGAEYWVAAKPRKNEHTAEQLSKQRLAEARIDGYQQQINLFALVIRPSLSSTNQDKLAACIADFQDALTGGSFAAETRPADASRARLVYATAGDMVAMIRTARPRVTITAILLAVAAFLGFLFIVLHPIGRTVPSGWISL